jgi:hypothetical protein
LNRSVTLTTPLSMLNKFIYFLILLSPTPTFSQSYISSDSANRLINNGGDCSDKTFIKIEKIPTLSIPKWAFEDSITSYLKSKNAYYNNETIRLRFVVTCHSEIKQMQKISGNSSNENEIQKAILKFSNLWLPGRQNGYITNSYVSLEMKIENDKLAISISQ